LSEIIERERELSPGVVLEEFSARQWRRYKQWGFSDPQIADLCARATEDVTALRRAAGVVTTFKTVDTCAAEFEASTRITTARTKIRARSARRARPGDHSRFGPESNCQGIEFDYCCVHASLVLRDMGYETIMVNCNPETVSTDYSTSDRLYFEPLTPEDVAEVVAAEQAACVDGARVLGVIVSLADRRRSSFRTPSTPRWCWERPSPRSTPPKIESSGRRFCTSLGLRQPPGDVALNLADAKAIVRGIGYPVLVRPSYVLGGRAMEIVYDDASLERVMKDLTSQHGSLAREGGVSQSRPILIDSFLEDAIEVDVDAVRDRPVTSSSRA